MLLGTPVAVCGAFAALLVGKYENNVYAQIGLVMLIGLSAKNSILIVEFAKAKYEEGLTLFDAALEGAKLRLRPILMTSFAFILGVRSAGYGERRRRPFTSGHGYVVIGGVTAASFGAVFLIPVLFYLPEKYSGRKPHPKRSETPALAASHALAPPS